MKAVVKRLEQSKGRQVQYYEWFLISVTRGGNDYSSKMQLTSRDQNSINVVSFSYKRAHQNHTFFPTNIRYNLVVKQN